MIEVTAALIVHDGNVLACQRSLAGSHPGKFEFPGGKREPGESLEQCLARELSEELGIEAIIGRLLWTTEFQYPGREPVRLFFYTVDSYHGTPINRVFHSLCWQPIGRLAELDFLDGDREFVARVDRGD